MNRSTTGPEANSSSYKSWFVDETTLDILRDTLYNVPASETNVVLLMNIFDLQTVNPAHPTDDPEGPTDVIFFCIRFAVNNTYQPIGGILTHSDRDQSDVIADCIKRMHRDLYEMGVQVLCSVSPHYKIFKNVIRKLNPNKNFDEEPGAIYYTVYPMNNVIHLYDAELLMWKFHRIFMQRDIKFKTKCGPPHEHFAVWPDLFYTLNACSDLSIYLKFFYSKGSYPRQMHLFSQSIWLQYLELQNKGVLSPHSNGGAMIISTINAFMGIFTCEFLLGHEVFAYWEQILHTFGSLVFVKPELVNIPKETLNQMNKFKESPDFLSIEKEDFNQYRETVNKSVKGHKKERESNDVEQLSETVDELNIQDNGDLQENKSGTTQKVITENKIDGVTADIKSSHSFIDINEKEFHCENKNCTGCVVTVDINNRLKSPGSETEAEKLAESDHGGIKKIPSKKNKKKKLKKKEQNSEMFGSMDKLLIDLLDYHDKNMTLDQQWAFVNKLKQLRLTKEVSVGPNGEFCTLPCINGRDVLWEEPLDIDAEQEPVVKEVLCTLKGLFQLISMLIEKNITRIKSDSLLTQPLEKMVTQIQREYNKMKLVYYFGRFYKCLDPELVSFTLDNSKSLYLIKKD